MLVIRLARTGKKHQAYFRVVVAESKRAVTAKFIEILGNYDPHAKKLVINTEKLEKYLKNGAQPSEAVAKLLIKEKIQLPKWVKVTEKKKAPKKEPEVKPVSSEAEKAPAVEAKAEAAEENTEATDESDTAEATTDKEAAPAENSENTETPEVAEEAPAEASEPAEPIESDTAEATTDKEAAEEAAPEEDSDKKEEGETSKE